MSIGRKLVEYDSTSSSDDETTDEDYTCRPSPESDMHGNINFDDFFVLGEPDRRYVKRYQTEGISVPFQFQNMDKLDDIHAVLPNIFDRVATKLFENVSPNAQVGFELNHEHLSKPIVIPFQQKKNLNGLQIVTCIEKILQSNEKVDFDTPMTIRAVIVNLPSGNGKRRPISWRNFIDSHAVKSGCVIRITSNDLCLPRAVVTAIGRINRKINPRYYDSIIRGDKKRYTLQKREAQNLMKLAGLENHVGSFGVEEIRSIQNVLVGFQIKVFSKDFMNALIFKGD